MAPRWAEGPILHSPGQAKRHPGVYEGHCHSRPVRAKVQNQVVGSKDFCPFRAAVDGAIYPGCRFACPGLCRGCPFRACVNPIDIPPGRALPTSTQTRGVHYPRRHKPRGVRKPHRHHPRGVALPASTSTQGVHKPHRHKPQGVRKPHRHHPPVLRHDGLNQWSPAHSGKDINPVRRHDGLKALYSIAQGKRSGTLGFR